MSSVAALQSAQLRREEAPQPPQAGAARALLALDGVFLAISLTFILLAPAGFWWNHVMSVSMWRNGDPGSGYVMGSLYAFTLQRRDFVGHPGLPIPLLIGTFAKLIHLAYRAAGGPENLFEFWARHMRALFVLGSLLISILHVISFHVLFAFVKRLATDARVAFIAVAAYATSFPVLFYSTRISPEPLLVITFLLTIMALWNVQKRLDDGLTGAACAWTAGAAIASVAAVYVKIHLAAALPVFACIQLLTQNGSRPQRIAERVLKRLRLLGVFVPAAAATALLGMLKVDWPWFFNWWTKYAPGHYQLRGAARVAHAGVLKGAWINMTHNLGQWVPGMTQVGVFGIAESLFILLALPALLWYWKRHHEKRALIVWPLAYCALVIPIVIYRGLWHYLFLHLAIASGPLAMLISHFMERWPPLRRAGLAAPLGLVLLMHSVSLIFFTSSKIADVRAYRQSVRPYYVALGLLGPGERVAVVSETAFQPSLVYGLPSSWITGASEYKESFSALFVPVRSPDQLSEPWMRENRIGAVVQTTSGITQSRPLKPNRETRP